MEFSSGGPFLDGYILSIIAIALTQITPQLHLDATWSGLVGASALIGIFIGGFLGYVTDKVGRQLMYTIDFILLIVASILQFWIQTGWELFVIRLILGISIGADYPIATSLLAEFSPKKHRGMMLGVTLIAYYVGSTVAYIVGELMLSIGPDAWRWMLASSAVPAVILVLLRLGTPESCVGCCNKVEKRMPRTPLKKSMVRMRHYKTSLCRMFRTPRRVT